MKRYYIPGLAALAVVALIAIYFLFIRSSNAYKAIPRSAVAVIEVNSWPAFADKLNTTYTGAELKKTDVFTKLQTQINTIAELAGTDATLKTAVNDGNTLVSVYLTSAEDYDFLYTTSVNGVNDNALLNKLQSSPKVKAVHIRIFKNRKVMEVVLRNGQLITFANMKGVLAYSFTSFLTEASVSTVLNNVSIEDEKSFTKAHKAITNIGDARVYFNFAKFDVILPLIVKPAKAPLLNDMQQFADWTGVALTFSNNEIALTGATLIKGSMAGVAGSPLASILTLIPDNAAVANITVVDTTQYRQGEMLNGYFKEWAHGAKAFVTVEPLQDNFADKNLFVVQTINKDKTIAQLRNLISAEGGDINAADTYAGAPIYRLKNGGAINRVYGNTFTSFNEVWFTVTDKAAFFCNSQDVLKLVLDKIANGENITKGDNATKVNVNGNRILYINTNRAKVMLSGLLKNGSTINGFIKQFNNILITSQPDGKMLRIEGVLKAGEAKTISGLLWKTQLKTLSTYTPQIVMNAESGEKEIFTQDTAGNIYLMGSSGEIIFTHNITDPILGKVYQLDYYNNGALQYVFNTANHIYIIDRVGGDVASYPIRLSRPATAGLTLLTDSGAHTYRYFVPCANNAVYGYESNGRPLSGYSPKGGVGMVVTPVQAFAAQGKFHVAVFNTDGTLNVFDIRGNKEVGIDDMDGTTAAPALIQQSTGYRFVKAFGKQLIELGSDGNDNTSALLDSANYFTAMAVTDTTYQYYYANGNQLRCYNNQNKFIKSVVIKGTITNLQTVHAGGYNYIAITDSMANKVYLYTLQLDAVTDVTIPATGSYRFTDLFDRNELMLLVTTPNGSLSCTRVK